MARQRCRPGNTTAPSQAPSDRSLPTRIYSEDLRVSPPGGRASLPAAREAVSGRVSGSGDKNQRRVPFLPRKGAPARRRGRARAQGDVGRCAGREEGGRKGRTRWTGGSSPDGHTQAHLRQGRGLSMRRWGVCERRPPHHCRSRWSRKALRHTRGGRQHGIFQH